ncbi:MAG: zinc-ribbon domain containing protein [Candidatus Hydrothermarchaeales archaeon]
MSFEDKTITCRDCGQDFVFTAGEQEFYQERGFENEPSRCKPCREKRKAQRMGRGRSGFGERRMYPVVCASCGKETEVPFKPDGDRPVYCRDCFRR